MFTDFRGKRREGERERHECERETCIICLSYTPPPEINPTLYVCALTGNWTHNLSVYGTLQPHEPLGQPCSDSLELCFSFWAAAWVGIYLLVQETTTAGLFFLYLWFMITARKFFWGVNLNMPLCITICVFWVKHLWWIRFLGALWGKCWWRNTSEENFSLSGSYLRKQAPFIL